MRDFSVFDTNLQVAKLSTYVLLINTDKDGLSYSIVDPIRKIYLAQVYYSFNTEKTFIENLTELFQKDKYIRKKYKQVNFSNTSQCYTLVPTEYFDKSKIATIFELNFQKSKNEEIHFNLIRNQVYNIFSIDGELIKFLIEKIPEVRIYNHASVLINFALHAKSNLINISKNLLDVVLIENNKLKLAKSFTINSIEDAVYLILKIFSGTIQNHILIFGDFVQENEFLKILESNLSNLKVFNNYPLMYNFKIPKHWLALTNLSYLIQE